MLLKLHPGINPQIWSLLRDTSDSMPITLASLAAELQLSPSRARRVFRSNMGTTIRSFVRLVRLHSAAKFLASGASLVKGAQFHCGYSNAASFSHAFHEHFGCSPRQYADAAAMEPLGLPSCTCGRSTLVQIEALWS